MTKMKMSASRLGAMVGADPRMSRLALFNELKYSDYEFERDAGKTTGNQAVDSGIKFEQPIAEMACELYDMTMIDDQPMKLATPDGTLVGHPDRYVVDENGEPAVLECKLLFRVPEELSHEWGPAGSDQVPVHYYLQALAYAMMAGLKRSYLAAWISGVGVRRYIIERNKPIEGQLLKDVKDMLQRVATDNPPDAYDEADMRARWFAQRKKEIEVNTDFVAYATNQYKLGQTIANLEKERKRLNVLILGTMQDASKAYWYTDAGEKVYVVSAGNDRIFNAAKFLADNPSVAADCQKLDTTQIRKKHLALYEQYLEDPPDITKARRKVLPLRAIKQLVAKEESGG